MKDINRILTSTNGVERSASDTHTQAAGLSVDWKRRFQSRSVCPGTWIPRQKSLKWMFPTRYLPRRDNTFKKTCRNLKLDLPPLKIELWLWASSYIVKPSSTNATHWFLKAMTNVSESECDCLPDCELTEFQHSHSAADFLWEKYFIDYWLIIVIINIFSMHFIFQAVWLSKPQSEPPLHTEPRRLAKILVAFGNKLINVGLPPQSARGDITFRSNFIAVSRWRRPTTAQWIRIHPTSRPWPALRGGSTRMT